MDIQKLPRLPMRREDKPGYEQEIWQPNWACYCCRDTGIVSANLVTLVIADFDPKHDKLPKCSNPDCQAGENWDSEALVNSLDYRLSAATCQKLDALERESWRQTVKLKQSQISALTRQRSLRKRDRSSQEEMESQRRHEDACSVEPMKLRAMARKYLGDDYMENGSE